MDVVRFGDFNVHIDTSERRLYFKVYPVLDWTGAGNTKGTSYIKKDTGCDLLEEFDEDKVEARFEGSFCWCGVWEGRLYFLSEEYWGDELKEMSDLYETSIIPWLKAFIKNRDPNNSYDD